MACIQNLEAKDGIQEMMKLRLRSFTNFLRVCERDFVDVSYVFLFIGFREKDSIGFS